MSDLAAWLEKLGLGKYQEIFTENEVDFEVLPKLTEQDLKELAIPLGPRKKLLAAIAVLGPDGASIAVPKPPPAKPQAERRQLTVMFVDLVGSTALSSQLDPEDMRGLMLNYQNAVAGEITRFEGHVAKYMGDGVLAYFGWPRAHEDEAERAVRTGLAVTAAVAKLHAADGQPLAARVGIATGLVVVGDLIGEGAAQEETVVGETPNLAARLQALAAPGSVVIGAATRQLVGEVFALEGLGAHKLKGIARPVEAYAVCGERAGESRFQALRAGRLLPMMGREQELSLLLERWRLAVAGEGQVVLLSGEAGMGKSRLAQALIDAIGADDAVLVPCQCSPYHSDSALYPLIQQIRRSARLQAEDSPDRQLDKLEALLEKTPAVVADAAPLFAMMLALPAEHRYGQLELTPAQQRVRMLETLIDWLLARARRNPVLLILEDAHWSDPTTLELLERMLDRLSGGRILLLMTARPAFAHSLSNHSLLTRLTLNRLSQGMIEAIVRELGGNKALPKEVVNDIVSKTDGIPLFIEELTRTLLESGLLREAGDAYLLDKPLISTDVPGSLHDLLMARLDRLQSVKEVAQTAACFGREFSYVLLGAVMGLDDDKLQAAIEQLIDADLIRSHGQPPEAQYTFKHTLLRDAAYESLLKSKRQSIHARILNAQEASREELMPELLAQHATAAGQTEKAIAYWRSASESMIARPAYREAISHLRQAVELVQTLGSTSEWKQVELELWVKLGQASIHLHGHAHPETVEVFERARALLDVMDQTPLAIAVLSATWSVHLVRAEVRPARDCALALRELPYWDERYGSQKMLSLRFLATLHTVAGEFDAADKAFSEVLALEDIERDARLTALLGMDQRVTMRCWYGFNLWCRGYPCRARAALDKALEFGADSHHPASLAFALSFMLWFLYLSRDLERWQIVNRQLTQIADTYEMTQRRYYTQFHEALMRLQEGERGDAITLGEQARTGLHVSHSTLFSSYGDVIWSRLLAELGQVSKALALMQQNLASIARNDYRMWHSEVWRRYGDILALGSSDGSTKAEAAYLRALEIARSQNARGWELRAATSLAGLWRDQGKRQKARDLLAPIYDWFSEGFETADLKDAKALLAELT